MERDVGVQMYVMVPRQVSAVEMVVVVGGVVNGVLWDCSRLVPNLMYLSTLTLFGAKY